MNTKELLYYNDFGGFSKDGKEYIIKTNEKYTPMPWSHIIANEKFGTLITANGGGYTWSGNSRENKLTTWSNDPITDRPSEVLEFSYEEKNIELLPYSSLENFIVKFGFGYANFEKTENNFYSNVNIFVPIDESKKIYNIKIKNESDIKKEIKIKYKAEIVMGVSREYTKKHLVINKKENGVIMNNFYRENYSDETMYITTNEKLENIEVKDKIVYLNINLVLDKNEEKNFIIELGISDNLSELEITKNPNDKLEKVNTYWEDFTSKIKIRTPVESMNIIMNGWLLYQTVTSRLMSRTGFYQASGAFGFRDQLQDSIMLLYFNPELTKKQILYHAEHQFLEGDVLHWWHPEKDNGIRTKFTDDLLWFPYVLYEYIEKAKDYSILDIEVPYVEMRALEEFEDERYDNVVKTNLKESIYIHAKKAIEKSLVFGENGLPQIGSRRLERRNE